MDRDTAILIEDVSKKYCKSLRRSMLYGLEDLGRNSIGMRSRSSKLRRDEFWAVDNVALKIKRGETVGLIGPNGSGKTTLLKMINGIFWPDKGKISVRGRVGALIAVGAGFHPMLTGRENVFINAAIMGMKKAEVLERFDAIVDFAEVADFLDTPVKFYSSGMFVRLGFAVAVHANPDVMLVDEVLAVGDRGFQVKCFKKMGELRDTGTTFVVVSHNMHTIAGFVDYVVLINKGELRRYDDVFEGIELYSRMSLGDGEEEIEKLVMGGEHVEFGEVQISDCDMKPGDSFTMTMAYACTKSYQDVEIDLAVYDQRDHDLYYQATNAAYGERVDLREGNHELSVTLRDLQMSSSTGRIVVSIWSKDRTEHLFWWRVPVRFGGVAHSTGKNFFPVSFATRNKG